MSKYRDYIGFNPTQNQSEYGTPQVSPYGLAVESTPPMARLDYYPSWPLRGEMNYQGNQVFGLMPSESLYAFTFGYRGILPIEELPTINKALPYE